MSISQYRSLATNKLKSKTKNPHLEAEILLSYVLKKPREYLLSHSEKKLTKTQITNYQSLITKRLKGIPIAYLVGYKYFHGLKFYVNKHVLIPRPETELIVDEALKHVKGTKFPIGNLVPFIVIDVGTGSGCIIISLAKKYPISNIQYLATDISKPALAVAHKNAKLHQVDKKIKFLRGNLLKPILNNLKISKNNNKSPITPASPSEAGRANYQLLITANLPYLSPSQIKKSSSIRYEPKLALDAGKDGLKYYRKLFKQVIQITPGRAPLSPPKGRAGGAGNYQLPITIFLEIDPTQTQKIKKLIKENLPQAKIQIKKDLRGLDRLAIIKFNN